MPSMLYVIVSILVPYEFFSVFISPPRLSVARLGVCFVVSAGSLDGALLIASGKSIKCPFRAS